MNAKTTIDLGRLPPDVLPLTRDRDTFLLYSVPVPSHKQKKGMKPMGAKTTGGPVFFNLDPPKMVTEDRQERIDRTKENHHELLRLLHRDLFKLAEDGNCDQITFLLHLMAYTFESMQQIVTDSGKCIDCKHLDCPAHGKGPNAETTDCPGEGLK